MSASVDRGISQNGLAGHRRRVLEVLTRGRRHPLAADEVAVARLVCHQGIRGTWAGVDGHGDSSLIGISTFESLLRPARTNGAVDDGRSAVASVRVVHLDVDRAGEAVRLGGEQPAELLAQPRQLGTHGDHAGPVAVQVGGQLGRRPAVGEDRKREQDLGVPQRDVVAPAAELADHLQRRRPGSRRSSVACDDVLAVRRRPAGPASRRAAVRRRTGPSVGNQQPARRDFVRAAESGCAAAANPPPPPSRPESTASAGLPILARIGAATVLSRFSVRSCCSRRCDSASRATASTSATVVGCTVAAGPDTSTTPMT